MGARTEIGAHRKGVVSAAAPHVVVDEALDILQSLIYYIVAVIFILFVVLPAVGFYGSNVCPGFSAVH